jgi:hypothetical protein
MANPAPVLRLTGTVHGSPREREVPPQAAVPAVRDEHGVIMTRARDARPGYTVQDVTVLTEGGGFVTVIFRDEAIEAAGGYLPGAGDKVEGLPVFQYVAWGGPEGRRYAQAAVSFAGTVYADENGKSAASGRRLAEASHAS